MNRIALSDPEFAAVASLLHDAAGLSFDDSRRDSLGFSIAERMSATQISEVSTYLAMLTGPEGGRERQALLDEVTIPETHFFRNPPQIRALRKYVMPELLRQAAEGKKLRVWSAGCSTGEEAYTVAILIRELLPPSVDWDIKVLATDVSTRALSAGKQAHYGERAFVMTDPLDLGRWFVMDTTTGSWVVRDEVRELVEFRHHNLVTDPPPFDDGEVDLILCRNVTIYFDRETTRRLMKRLHSRLRDGGYLFLGHAETLWQISDDFTLVPLGDAFVYRRLEEPAETSGEERRWVLPDRRTEDEPRPTRADRRRGDTDRRGRVVRPVEIPNPAPARDAGDADHAPGCCRTRRADARPAGCGPVGDQGRPLRRGRGRRCRGRRRDAAMGAGALLAGRRAHESGPRCRCTGRAAQNGLSRPGTRLCPLPAWRRARADWGADCRVALLPGCCEHPWPPQDGRRRAGGGGRSVAELAALCMQLAHRAEADVRPAGDIA